MGDQPSTSDDVVQLDPEPKTLDEDPESIAEVHKGLTLDEDLESIVIIHNGLTYVGVFREDGTTVVEYSKGKGGEKYKTKITKDEINAFVTLIMKKSPPPDEDCMVLAGITFRVINLTDTVRVALRHGKTGDDARVSLKVSGYVLVSIGLSRDSGDVFKLDDDVADLLERHNVSTGAA